MTKIAAVFCTLGCLFVAGCHRQTSDFGWLEGEQERLALASQVELRKVRLEQLAPIASVEDLEAQQRHSRDLKHDKAELERLKESLQKEVASLDASRSAALLAVETDIRAKACGKSYETFALPSGRQFTKVSVVSVSDNGVLIRHEGGLARLGYADLSPDQRELFALSEGKSAQAEKIKAANEALHERLIRSSEVKTAVGKSDPPQLVANLPDTAYTPPSASPAKRTGPLAQGPRTFGNPNRVRRYRSYSVYRGSTVYFYNRPAQPVVVCPSQTVTPPNP